MDKLILSDTASVQALQAQAFPLSFGVATLAGVVAGAVIYSLYVRKQLYVIPYLIAGFSAAVLIRYWMGMEAPLSIVRAVGDPDLLAFFGFLLALLATIHAFEAFGQFEDDQPARTLFGGTNHNGSGPGRRNWLDAESGSKNPVDKEKGMERNVTSEYGREWNHSE